MPFLPQVFAQSAFPGPQTRACPVQLGAAATHVPLTHACPFGHPAFAPHLQTPPVQLSPLVRSQAVQALPAVPQAATVVGRVQVLAAVQQPSGHEVESQTH